MSPPGCALARPLTVLLLALQIHPLASQTPSERLALSASPDSLGADRGHRPAARAPACDGRGGTPGSGQRTRRASGSGWCGLRLAELGAVAGCPGARSRRSAAPPRSGPSGHSPGTPSASPRRVRAAWERADRLALGSRVGLRTLERAASRHRRALEADPSFAPAAVALAALTLELRDTALLASAVGCAAPRRRGAGPAARGVARAGAGSSAPPGNADSAGVAFERYLAAGGSRAPGPARARPHPARRRRRRRPSGAYYEGAALDDSVGGRGLPRRPGGRGRRFRPGAVRPVARAGPGRGAAALLDRPRPDRDARPRRAAAGALPPAAVRPPPLRADREPPLLRPGRRLPRQGGMEIDDRGVIYVRHGEPDGAAPAVRLRAHAQRVLALRPGRGRPPVPLQLRVGLERRRRPVRLPAGRERARPARRGGRARGSAPPLAAVALQPVRPDAQLGAVRRGAIAGAGARDRAGQHRDRHHHRQPRAASSPSRWARWPTWWPWAPRARRDRPPRVRHRRAGDPARAGAGGVRYAVRVRAVASDRADRPFADVDTTLVFRPSAPLGRGQYLIGRVELPLPPGLWTWRAAFQLGDSARRGAAERHGASDAGRARRSPSATWRSASRGASARGSRPRGDTVLLTPFDLFREGSEVELYYEAGGATAGAPYRHEIAVFRIKGEPGVAERRPVVTLGFDERATGAAAPVAPRAAARPAQAGTLSDRSAGAYTRRTAGRAAAGVSRGARANACEVSAALIVPLPATSR